MKKSEAMKWEFGLDVYKPQENFCEMFGFDNSPYETPVITVIVNEANQDRK